MSFTESYRRVPYDLRPAKQVERRMLLDSFQLLAQGFPIGEYQYTGFGSIYFVDFILLHKFLGIRRLLSIEHDPVAGKRATFNLPYEIVRLRVESAADAIPQLSPDLGHILWLDYDFGLEQTIVADIISATFRLSKGSVFLITVDAEPPRDDEGKVSPAYTRDVFRGAAGDHWDPTWSDADFSASNLPIMLREIILRCIADGLSARPDIAFEPLYSFRYRDGNWMFTFGGMLCTEAELNRLNGCSLSRAHYLRRDRHAEPYTISVPRLTRKERLHLDSQMPAAKPRAISRLGLTKQEISAYTAVYRFLPSYIESLL